MKALFVHDHKFIETASKAVYSSGQFPYTVWEERYLSVFDELHVIGRIQNIAQEDLNLNKLNKSSGSKVSFSWVPNLNEPSALLTNMHKAWFLLSQAINDADAVIARTSTLGKLAVLIARLQKKPYAIEVVGSSWDALWNYGTWVGKAYAPIAETLTKVLVKDAPYVLYVSRDFLPSHYPTGGHTCIASNVQISQTPPDVLVARLEKIKHMGAPVTLGLIGSLTSKYKGIDTAFRALSLIKSQLPPFQLRILGPGDPTPWLRLAGDFELSAHVFFDGILPGGDPVLNWLDSIDLYLQPSYQEGLPRSLVEAMSRGCPALGAITGGIPELLKVENLHSPKDAKTLSEQILFAIQSSTWMLDEAQQNFIVAKEYYAPSLQARRHEFWTSFANYAAQSTNN